MQTTNSNQLFEKSSQLFPGGVNSPVRAFRSVGGKPVFIKSSQGAYLNDVDGNSFIDYICSWGPMILGHGDPSVLQALTKQMQQGLSFGACHELEIQLAELVMEFFPKIEMMRFVSSGTEACMAAIRLARGYTKREKIIKFSGCYHGHFDSFLVDAGSGVATFGLPNSPGVPENLAKQTFTAEFNDLNSVKTILEKYPDSVAAVIVEPVVGNAGCIIPQTGFLEGLRELCDEYGSVLIFDEVMTGFRLSKGGAQELYGVKPDLTTLGKVIGGGLPVGAYGGKKGIMSHIAPAGPVYQAGTLSGNPMGMACGIATLNALKDGKAYEILEDYGRQLEDGINGLLKQYSFDGVFQRVGSMMSLFFTDLPSVQNFTDAKTCNLEKFGKFFNLCLESGIYLPPSQFEAWFTSIKHGKTELDKTLSTIEKCF
jgi:glutamate-1-semialdehyde 2,1-aminomutase